MSKFQDLNLAKCHYCDYQAKSQEEEACFLFFGHTESFCNQYCLAEYAGVDVEDR